MEIVAKKPNKVFSLDKIDFEKQPRSQRVSDRTRADLRRKAAATSATSMTRPKPMLVDTGRWGLFRFDSG